MMKSIIFLLALVAVTSASQTFKLQFKNLFKDSNRENVDKHLVPRIIGGQEVVPHSRPFQVFLEMYTATQAWYCGGSVISENYILTAAHCGIGVVEARVYLGRHNISQSESTALYLVSNNVTIHPEYDASKIHYDIGVVKLPESLTFTDAIQPINLPTRAQANNALVDEIAIVSGWGRTDGFTAGISSVLNSVAVKVISNAECSRDFNILDSIICVSGDEMTGSCSGDSGGPLTLNNEQIGVVSFGIQNCLPGYPSAFSRVAKFLDWIEQNSDVVIL